MRVLKLGLVVAGAAVASIFGAVPAGAAGPALNKPVILGPLCPQDGSITLTKTSDKPSYHVNDIVTFTLKVHANNCPVYGITIQDQLPVGLTVSDPSVLNKNLGNLPADGEATYSFKAIAVANGTLTNNAVSTGYAGGTVKPGEGCVPPPPPPIRIESRIIVDNYYCKVSDKASARIEVGTPPGPQGPPGPPGPQGPPGNTPGLPNTGRQM